MPTVKGVNQTLIDAGGLTSQIAAGLVDARVKVRSDSYVLTTGNAAGDVIELFGDLPAGAKIHKIELAVTAAQTSLTFSLGDSETADRYLAASNNALQTAITPFIIEGKEYVIGTIALDSQIILTTADSSATAATLYAKVFYSVD